MDQSTAKIAPNKGNDTAITPKLCMETRSILFDLLEMLVPVGVLVPRRKKTKKLGVIQFTKTKEKLGDYKLQG